MLDKSQIHCVGGVDLRHLVVVQPHPAVRVRYKWRISSAKNVIYHTFQRHRHHIVSTGTADLLGVAVLGVALWLRVPLALPTPGSVCKCHKIIRMAIARGILLQFWIDRAVA
jgi:hypothetical protein